MTLLSSFLSRYQPSLQQESPLRVIYKKCHCVETREIEEGLYARGSDLSDYCFSLI